MIVTFPLCLRYALPAEDDDASFLVSGRLRQGLVSAPVQSAAAAQLIRDLLICEPLFEPGLKILFGLVNGRRSDTAEANGAPLPKLQYPTCRLSPFVHVSLLS